MREYRLESGLERTVIDGFALPLGFVPRRGTPPFRPTPGYTVEYTSAEGDDPDTYSIYAVASHEHLAALVGRLFRILPPEVHGIVEIGSRDAYRALDVYMGSEPISRDTFLRTWKYGEDFLLEDGSIGAGANGEDPFLEVFVDQWKGVSIHLPLLMRDEVEAVLTRCGLAEVSETWPPAETHDHDTALELRSVLATHDEFAPGVDEMLLELRRDWKLELNVDPETNLDDSGRNLGRTLWHTMVIIDARGSKSASGYASIWATAGSLAEMERLAEQALDDHRQWQFGEIYTIDRVAFDERPPALTDLSPKRVSSGIHLVEFDT